MMPPGGMFKGQGDSLPCSPDGLPVLHVGSRQRLQNAGVSSWITRLGVQEEDALLPG